MLSSPYLPRLGALPPGLAPPCCLPPPRGALSCQIISSPRERGALFTCGLEAGAGRITGRLPSGLGAGLEIAGLLGRADGLPIAGLPGLGAGFIIAGLWGLGAGFTTFGLGGRCTGGLLMCSL